jgi:excisionase family DNA binding protein
MTNDLDPGRFYGVTAVATRWGVSRDTVYRQINDGKLRARKIGRGWSVHGTEILKYETGSDFSTPAVPTLRTA